MGETRRVFYNGQAAVLEKQPDAANRSVLWKISQQDGTVGLTTPVGITAKGPAILKISAWLLAGPKDRKFAGVWFHRTVTPAGLITWTESGAEYQEGSGVPYAGQPNQFSFFSDRVTVFGPWVASFNDLVDQLWRTV